MLLNDYQNLTVFKVDNETFEAIGQITQIKSVNWGKYFTKYYEFKISVFASEQNVEILKNGNIIWGGKTNAGIIDVVQIDRDSNGQILLTIKGRTLESLLLRRVIDKTQNFKNKHVSTIVYSLVKEYFISSSNSSRNLPWFECAEDEELGPTLTTQRTGGDVYTAVKNICEGEENLGFEVQFIPAERKMLFVVKEATDHTATSDNPVIFSDTSDDIITDSYYENERNYKNMAYIAGQDSEDSERMIVQQGDVSSAGFERFELYVDARDLQQDDGETVLTDEEYESVLKSRGTEKLGALQKVSVFDGSLQLNKLVGFVYGQDYEIGDMVTVIDEKMGVQVDARVSCIQENVTEKYEAKMALGYEPPTLFERLKTMYN